MDGFVGKLLYSFVKMSLAWALWQAGWKSFRKPEAPGRGAVPVLTECDYCTEKESQRFRQTAAAYRSLPAPRYEKAVADYLFGKKQYGRASVRYEKLLAETEEKRRIRPLMGAFIRAFGAAYAQMFQFHRAISGIR